MPNRLHKRVAILFAGGPAPAANAVISTAAISFLRNGVEVAGIMHGYSALSQYGPGRELERGRDWIEIDQAVLKRTRNTQGILLGTSRSNPGKLVSDVAHLDDPERSAPLRAVCEGLRSIGVDALVSIGGDDTLKTANKIKLFQDRMPEDAPRMPIVHLPKTIDNDYRGIDFTFGYFTAVDTLAAEIRNLLHDAEACRSYFIVETMGRSAGWLSYGAAIAGEASLVISIEDLTADLRSTEVDAKTGVTRDIMDIERVVDLIVDAMCARDAKGKSFGAVVVSEGLAELLPMDLLRGIERDEHGHIMYPQANLARVLADLVAETYQRRTGNPRKVRGVQLGYESRCAPPHAFVVMLGSQLGVGAYRALCEEGLDGVMVSVSGQLELHYVPFEQLVDPNSLVTVVRYIERDSDFHRLARFLETYLVP